MKEIATINFSDNDLTGVSSPLIGDIITHLQPHTVMLANNNINRVSDISTAIINTNTVKTLNMWGNGLTAQEASAMSNTMTCLEGLLIGGNKRLGDEAVATYIIARTEKNKYSETTKY